MTRCPTCHRLRYIPDTQLAEWSRQLERYGPACVCPDAPRARDAFEELGRCLEMRDMHEVR